SSLSLRLRYFFTLTTLPQITRWLILQQARIQKINFLYSACKLVISGSISLPTTGSFHLSFTVLFTIGFPLIFSLTRRSSQIHTEFHVFHVTWVIFAAT